MTRIRLRFKVGPFANVRDVSVGDLLTTVRDNSGDLTSPEL